MRKDPYLTKGILFIIIFMIVVIFFNGYRDRIIRDNYKYTIIKEENNSHREYHVNEYKIDGNGCIHFLDLDSLTLCGNYEIRNNR